MFQVYTAVLTESLSVNTAQKDFPGRRHYPDMYQGRRQKS